jgi:hypothetical protein
MLIDSVFVVFRFVDIYKGIDDIQAHENTPEKKIAPGAPFCTLRVPSEAEHAKRALQSE